MKTISELEKCLPNRSNIYVVNWDVLKKKTNDRGLSEKPTLPLSILLKVGGPPKIVDSYKIVSPEEFDRMENIRHNISNTGTPVNIVSFGDHGLESPRPQKDKSALPPKPVLLQNRKVLGRYFPKPIPLDDRRFINSQIASNLRKNVTRNRPDTIFSSSPGSGVFKSKNVLVDSGGLLRESRTLSNFYNPRLLRSRKAGFERSGDRLFLSAGLRSSSCLGGIGITGSVDSQSDKSSSDYSTIQKISTNTRHVTFPDKTIDFSDILKGTTKMLHRREMEESQSAPGSEKSSNRVTFKETTSISLINEKSNTEGRKNNIKIINEDDQNMTTNITSNIAW